MIKEPEIVAKKPDPKDWHPQQSKLLKSWAEIASSYRWMHNQAYMIYRKKNLWFMLPLIVMSTVAGTANFAQSTFPDTIRPYVPQIIGAINLVSAILTTIYQFLKISEFMESHRISSINYGKLARTITIELNLPVKDRNSGGAECVKVSRTEIDRLIEQSPAIPKHVLLSYERQFAGRGLSEPEIIVINRVDIFEDQENKVATTVSEAGVKFKTAIQRMKKPLFQLTASNSPTEKRKDAINQELKVLTTNKLVSTINTETKVANILSRFGAKKDPVPPVFKSVPAETVVGDPFQTIEQAHEPELVEGSETVDHELIEPPEQQDELETLRMSRLVSAFKK
jgi:hypothetical protein